MIHATVKSHRSALFAFCIQNLHSIPILLEGRFLRSLFPMESFLKILGSVCLRHWKAASCSNLAIKESDLLSCFYSRLLADAIMVSDGFLLTPTKPLASQQTVFTPFLTKLVPTGFPDDPPDGSYMKHRSSILISF